MVTFKASSVMSLLSELYNVALITLHHLVDKTVTTLCTENVHVLAHIKATTLHVHVHVVASL